MDCRVKPGNDSGEVGRAEYGKGNAMNIAQVDYDGLIPNNVALGQDVRVKRALEKIGRAHV